MPLSSGGSMQQLRECRVTARKARPIPRAPTAFCLPVLPLFASSVALRLLPVDRARPRGLRQSRRLRDPPKRHPRSRELQALWSGPDHACAPGCAARMPADLQAGRFQRQAGPPRPRDLRDPVKHPGRVQTRLEGTRDQLLPLLLAPHRSALSPPPALARAPWALGRQKFRFHCGVAAACRRSSRRVSGSVSEEGKPRQLGLRQPEAEFPHTRMFAPRFFPLRFPYFLLNASATLLTTQRGRVNGEDYGFGQAGGGEASTYAA